MTKKSDIFFVSSKVRKDEEKGTKEVTSSLIANCMTRSFEKAKVLNNSEKFGRISCSRIRATVVTEIAGVGNEDMKTVAHVFMKHRPETCKKFYVQNWANRESLRISMKCYDKFTIFSKDVRDNAIKARQESKVEEPTKEKLRCFLMDLFTNKHYDKDDNLLKQLNLLSIQDVAESTVGMITLILTFI